MIDYKDRFKDKLQWMEVGVDYSESPDKNPNEHCFTLAMPWEEVEPIIKNAVNQIKELEEELDRVKRAFAIYLRPDECACDKKESEVACDKEQWGKFTGESE